MSGLFALTTNQTLWWITLGVGLVVALVVLALLETLRRSVEDINRAATELWTMGKRLAQNTQTTHLLHTTEARGGELLAEAEQHRSSAEGRYRSTPS